MPHGATLIFAAVLVALTVSASAKTGSVLYPPERVENARRNIERYDWARATRDHVVAAADRFARQSDDFLWELVTPPDIPRGTQVNVARGCPKCGKEIERFGTYPWKVDVFNKPWKIECPSCGESYPKNDFAKFYESGKDEHGVFRYERADRSLLFNADHPDPADPLHGYCVDDTLGWEDSDGTTFRFIGYYGHYGTWAAVLGALRQFEDAYVYTGDPVYARKAGLILYRIAQFYPEMDWMKWHKLGFANSHGGTGEGKVYGRIWEMNVANGTISAYDAIYLALDDPHLLDYISRKTGKPVDAAGLRSLIERNIVQEVHDAILGYRIAGNEGMHQSSMALAAVVMDTPGLTEKWLDWIFAPGDLHRGDPGGGNIARLFEQKIDDDGMGNEGSPIYNGLWRKTFRNIADAMDRYPSYKGPRITDFPKYRKMYESAVRLICLDRYIPHIGDCAKTGDPGTGGITVGELVYAYQTFGDPLFAQMAFYLNGNRIEGIRGGIFDADPMAVARDIEEVVREHGPYVPSTEELPFYGLAVLRGGSGERARALTLYHGRNTGHAHRDTLNIELFGLGVNLMPDLGYPEHATVWAPRSEWTSNTISHNTVVVDRMKQRDHRLGKVNFLKQGSGAAAVEVRADEPYPQTSLYQRTMAMVDISDEDFYLVDIFRVRGGREHHYSLHGPEGTMETEGLNLVAQEKGTLAGEDIPYGADLGGRESRWADASGFQYLYDIRRDTCPGPCPGISWAVKDTWRVFAEPRDISLRMNLVSPPGEVILGHGDPSQNKEGNPRRLTYVILPNEGGESTFVTVIEPYSGSRTIKSISRGGRGGTVTLEIRLASGRVDYIFSTARGGEALLAQPALTIISQDGGHRTERLVVDR